MSSAVLSEGAVTGFGTYTLGNTFSLTAQRPACDALRGAKHVPKDASDKLASLSSFFACQMPPGHAARSSVLLSLPPQERYRSRRLTF